MTPSQRKRAEERRPKDLHFREECEHFKCGAKASWLEGYEASLKDAEALAKTLEFYSSEWMSDVYVGPTHEMIADSGARAREALRLWRGEE